MSFNEQEQEIIKYGLANGKSQDEVKNALLKFRTGNIPQDTPPATEQPSYLDRVVSGIKESANTRADKVGAIEARKDSNIAEKGLQILGQGAGLAADVIEKPIMEAPVVKQALGALGSGIEWLSQTAPIKALGDQIGGNKAIQEAINLYDTDQNFKDTVDATANLARLGMDVTAVEQSANYAKNVTEKIATKIGDKVSQIELPKIPKLDETLSNIKGTLAEKNIGPQVKTSAARIEKPVENYNSYIEQAKKSLADIKQDAPIASVGEKIGDEFNKVITQRRKVGALIGDELKKVGKVKTDITPAFTDFETSLNESGLKFSNGKIIGGRTAKMGTSDIQMLTNYVKELNKLGANPTIGEVDAFLARSKSLVGDFKSSKNIIGSTNAERLVTRNNSMLSSKFDAFPKLAKARAEYSKLSNFVKEGEGYLGKVTQSGDFSKDASLAKSSVQSILNNGKKDWLIGLENLTGYPALDDASLALQAMKDAGDFRGLSLLQTMSEGSIPTTKAGFTQKIIDYAMEKGARAFTGTPEEQTRQFLQSLEKSQSAPSAAKIMTATKAKTGLSASKIKNPSK